jgi:hypothetical protein
MRVLSPILALTSIAFVFAEDEPEVPTQSACERVEESPLPDDDAFFNFHQHDERLDPNQFVKVVFKIMSGLKPDPIKKVQLDYNPILHHLVGPYEMRSTVSHLSKDGSLLHNCYSIIINIHDTNECTHKGSKDWMHNCDASTQCVNTVGGYYCACPDTHFAMAGSGDGKCNGDRDSRSCCGAVTYDGAPKGDSACRQDFICHNSSCAFNDCDPNAVCVPGNVPNTYSCQCDPKHRDVSPPGLPGRACLYVDHCAHAPAACPSGCDCLSVTNVDVDGYFCAPRPGFATYFPAHEYEWAA